MVRVRPVLLALTAAALMLSTYMLLEVQLLCVRMRPAGLNCPAVACVRRMNLRSQKGQHIRPSTPYQTTI